MQLNRNEIELLSKGLKYSPHLPFKKSDFEILGINTEIALNKINSDNVTTEKHICANYITKCYSKYTKSKRNVSNDLKIIKSIQHKCNENDLILCKADKGNTVVIFNRADYINKMSILLNTDSFKLSQINPTAKFQKATVELLNKCPNLIPKNSIFKYKVMNPMSPTLYGLPKIHKENTPLRPIVSYINAPSYKLCKFTNKLLVSSVDCYSKFSVKNSLEFIEKTKTLQLPNNPTFVSFDVSSLFTSIPINELKIILNEKVSNSNLSIHQKTELLEILDLCVNQSYFQFNDNFYFQTNGLPMGSPLSPILAELFMSNFENTLLNSNSNLVKNVFFWCRYVDDIFCVWTGTERQLNLFLRLLNSINSKINFTIEKEQNNTLNFLDLTVSRRNNKFEYNIYRKPTTTDVTIPASSNQSNKIKLSVWHSLIHRLINVPLSKDNFNVELNIIKSMAINNGYSVKIIDNILKRKIKRQTQKMLYCGLDKRKDSTNFCSLNFINNVSPYIKNRISKFNINVIETNKTKLSSLLVNNKSKTDKLDRSGVYQLECKNCDAIYIGQCGRAIKNRILEHKRSIDFKQKTSGFSEHCVSQKHELHDDNIKVLHFAEKSKKLSYFENLEIRKALKKNKNLTNNQTELYTTNTPLLLSAL